MGTKGGSIAIVMVLIPQGTHTATAEEEEEKL